MKVNLRTTANSSNSLPEAELENDLETASV